MIFDLFNIDRVPSRLENLGIDGAMPGDAGGSTGGTTEVGPGSTSSTPPGPAGSPGASPVEDGGNDSSFFLSDDVMSQSDLDGFVEPQPDTSEGQQPVAPKQTAPPVTQATPAPQAPVPAAPVAPQPTVQPAGSAPTQPSALTPQTMLTQMLQNRDALLGELSSKRFALSPADAEAMETDALAHVPKLLARTYFDSMTSALNLMNTHVPTMIQTHLVEAGLDRDAEDSFYAAWPGLSKATHNADVLQFATAYRQMNPRASLEDAVRFVGAAVATKHGIANANQKPATQASPQRGNGAGRKTPPFAPGMGSRATPQAGTVVEDNPFSGLGTIFD